MDSDLGSDFDTKCTVGYIYTLGGTNVSCVSQLRNHLVNWNSKSHIEWCSHLSTSRHRPLPFTESMNKSKRVFICTRVHLSPLGRSMLSLLLLPLLRALPLDSYESIILKHVLTYVSSLRLYEFAATGDVALVSFRCKRGWLTAILLDVVGYVLGCKIPLLTSELISNSDQARHSAIEQLHRQLESTESSCLIRWTWRRVTFYWQ